MRCTIYMPYYGYDDDKTFDASEVFYKGENDYINAIKGEFNKSSEAVSQFANDMVRGVDGSTYRFGSDGTNEDEKVSYIPCECEFSAFDGGDNASTIDSIIEAFVKGNTMIEEIIFDFDTCDEDFLTEISLWQSEHVNISKLEKKFGEEWSWSNEPKRDLKIKFKNKSGEDVIAQLIGCKIMDMLEKHDNILFIEKVVLVDDI